MVRRGREAREKNDSTHQSSRQPLSSAPLYVAVSL